MELIWNAFNTRFVVGSTLAFNYSVGKLDVFGYHLFNIAAHILASFLVYELGRLTFKTPTLLKSFSAKNAEWVSLLAAIVFLTHPIQTQAVTYIWQRAASLATAFYLLTLVCYAKARLEGSRMAYGTAVVCAILGMLTKEITITLPFAVLLYEFFFLGKPGENTKKRLLPLLPFFLLLPLIPMMLSRANEITLDLMKSPTFDEQRSVTFWDMTRFVNEKIMPRRTYVLTQIDVLRTYLRLLFLPVRQNLDYDYPLAKSFFETPTFLSFILLLLVFLSGLALFRKHRLMAFGIFWFFLTLSIESFVPQKDVIFEHRLYLPMVGFSFFFAGAAFYIFRDLDLKRISLILTPVLLIYSFMTFHRNEVWKDELALWNDVVYKSPNKARGYFNRGSAYHRRGLIEPAMSDYTKAIALDPRYVMPYSNRAALSGALGHFQEALDDSNRALAIEPDYVDAIKNRAAAYFMLGNREKSLEDIRRIEELGGVINNPSLQELEASVVEKSQNTPNSLEKDNK